MILTNHSRDTVVKRLSKQHEIGFQSIVQLPYMRGRNEAM